MFTCGTDMADRWLVPRIGISYSRADAVGHTDRGPAVEVGRFRAPGFSPASGRPSSMTTPELRSDSRSAGAPPSSMTLSDPTSVMATQSNFAARAGAFGSVPVPQPWRCPPAIPVCSVCSSSECSVCRPPNASAIGTSLPFTFFVGTNALSGLKGSDMRAICPGALSRLAKAERLELPVYVSVHAALVVVGLPAVATRRRAHPAIVNHGTQGALAVLPGRVEEAEVVAVDDPTQTWAAAEPRRQCNGSDQAATHGSTSRPLPLTSTHAA